MQKWSCSRCRRIMEEISCCENCTPQEIQSLVSVIETNNNIEESGPSRVTEVLDSSQFVRNKHKNTKIDEEINKSAIEYKKENNSLFDSESAVIEDIFEETGIEENIEATIVLPPNKSIVANLAETTSPTVFIPTDSEIRDAFGEPPLPSTSDETFVQNVAYNKNVVPHAKKDPLPDIGGNALSTTQSQQESPSRFQRSDVIGGVFGRCRVIEKISEGAMGRVYKAYHQTLDKTVVLKELPPNLAASQELRERFIREAKASAKIHHQNVVQVLDAGYENGVYFYIMEYIDGATLEDIMMHKKKMPMHEICSIICDAARGLDVAHKQGVIHRDIKASNIMVTREGEVKVADFGLAYDLSNSKLSVAGQIMGTPQYMSPEQWDGANNVDARSDLYSLGITLYYILAKRLPFDSGSTVTLFKQHVSEKPPLLRNLNPNVPKALNKIVDKMMEKERDKRYQNAQEVITDLENFMANKKTPSSSRLKMIPLLFSIFLIIIAGFYIHRAGYISWNTTKEIKVTKKKKNKDINSSKNKKEIKKKNSNSLQVENNSQKNKKIKNKEDSKLEKSKNIKQVVIKKKTKYTERSNQKNVKKNIKNKITKKRPKKLITPKPIVLPRIKIMTKKKIYNSLPLTVYGKLKGKVLSTTKVIILFKKNGDKKYKKVRVKKNKFRLRLKNLSDGKYQIIPFVTDSRQKKKRIGKTQNILIDTKAPVITLHSPKAQQIFYEEKNGRNIDIRFSVTDSSSLKQLYLMHGQRKISLGKANFYKLTLQYGKQNCYILAQDKAGNIAKFPLTWALVPKNMIRIPAGNITVRGKQVAFKTFYIEKNEVTNTAYDSYLLTSNANPPMRWKKKNTSEWKQKPVVFVSYEEVKRYCDFQQKRLPTETEWIVAALWDNHHLRSYPWGENANVSWPRKVAKVKSWSTDTSFLGVSDLASNVSEWVEDNDGNEAVRKGGSFILNAKNIRRLKWDQVLFKEAKSSRKNWLGFRCAFSE